MYYYRFYHYCYCYCCGCCCCCYTNYTLRNPNIPSNTGHKALNRATLGPREVLDLRPPSMGHFPLLRNLKYGPPVLQVGHIDVNGFTRIPHFEPIGICFGRMALVRQLARCHGPRHPLGRAWVICSCLESPS